LGRPSTLLEALSAVVAAAAFAAMLGVLPVFLGGVRGLGLHDTGLVFWPGIAAAAIAAIVAGFVVPRRGASVLPILGLACLALAGWSLTQVAGGTGAAAIGQLAGLLGLGAGLAIVPGLLLAVRQVPRVFVTRVAALVLVLVVSGAALAQAATLRGLAASTTAHYLGLAAQVQSGWTGDGGALLDPTGLLQQPTAGGGALAAELLRQALVLGLRESGTVVLWIALLGLAASLVILVAGRFVPTPRALWLAADEAAPDDLQYEPPPMRW
jgi:hypothetical protein